MSSHELPPPTNQNPPPTEPDRDQPESQEAVPSVPTDPDAYLYRERKPTRDDLIKRDLDCDLNQPERLN